MFFFSIYLYVKSRVLSVCLYRKNGSLCTKCLPPLANSSTILLLSIPKWALTLYIFSDWV